MKDIDRIIRERRSHFVKEFTGEILPEDIPRRMIENAVLVPNHKSTKPWKFQIFGADDKVQLCLKMEEYYLKFTPPEKFEQRKMDKIRTYKNKISHIISVGYKPSGLVPEWEELASTAMAVQNMYLTLVDEAHAAGYWTSGNGTGSDFMKQHTGLLEDEKQLGFFFLGFVEEKRR